MRKRLHPPQPPRFDESARAAHMLARLRELTLQEGLEGVNQAYALAEALLTRHGIELPGEDA